MKPLQYRNISNVSVAIPGGTVTPAFSTPVYDSNNFPTGDLEIYEMYLRIYGVVGYTYSVAPTITTNGNEIFLKAFTLQSDKHGKIIDNVDGLGLYRIGQFRYGTAGNRGFAAIAASPGSSAFFTDYMLPFAIGAYMRPYDSILDLARSRLSMILQFGSISAGTLGGTGDLLTAGTLTVEQITALNYQVGKRVLNGPIIEPGAQGAVPETPEWMPSLELMKVDIPATQTGRRIPLPYADRVYRRIYISQRLSTTQAEQANNIIPDTSLVGIEVNAFPWADRMLNAQLQGINKYQFQAEALPSGWTVIDFDETERYPDMLSVLDKNNGTCNLVVDVTTVANAQLWVYLESYKPIPDQALRDSQLALRNATR
jgi:hypothetical protein